MELPQNLASLWCFSRSCWRNRSIKQLIRRRGVSVDAVCSLCHSLFPAHGKTTYPSIPWSCIGAMWTNPGPGKVGRSDVTPLGMGMSGMVFSSLSFWWFLLWDFEFWVGFYGVESHLICTGQAWVRSKKLCWAIEIWVLSIVATSMASSLSEKVNANVTQTVWHLLRGFVSRGEQQRN